MKIKKIFFLIIIFCILQSTNVNAIDEFSTINLENIEDNIEIENNNEETNNYNEGEILVIYEEPSFFANIRINMDFNFNKYEKDKTIELTDIHLNNNSEIEACKDENKSNLNMSLIKSDIYSTEELVEMFEEKDWVISACPNYQLKISGMTNDTYSDFQWAFENNGQNNGTSGKDINPIVTEDSEEKVVAVLDTGVDYTHEDLKDSMWINPFQGNGLEGKYGYDFVNKDDDPMDDHGHGTHCAGTICAQTNNNKGIQSVGMGAPNIKIMALKVFSSNGVGANVLELIEAYKYIYNAQELGVNVVAINNSFGSYVPLEKNGAQNLIDTLKAVVNLAGKKGALSVCAAGNESAKVAEDGTTNIIKDDTGIIKTANGKTMHIPSGLDSDYVICVGAVNEKDEIASFSNYGKSIDILAPGTNILSTTVVNKEQLKIEPMILNETEKKDLCATYYKFDNISENITYKKFIKKEDDDTTNTVTLSSKEFLGKNGSALKWNLKLTEDEISNMNGNIPTLFIETANYNNANVGLSILAKGPKNSNDMIMIMAMNSGGKNSKVIGAQKVNYNTWSHVNTIVKSTENDNYKGVVVMLNPTVAGEYSIYFENLMISKPLDEIENNKLKKYQNMTGTSMATPFVSGAVAVVSNVYKNRSPIETKELVLSATRETAITNDSETTKKILDFSKLKLGISSKEYSISKEKEIITKVPSKTLVKDLKHNIDGVLANLKVKDKEEKVLNNSDYISTGNKLCTDEGNFTIVVEGDINANGKIDLNDLAQAQKLFLKLLNKDEIKFLAADINDNNDIDLNDLAKMQKIFIGK